MDVRRGPGRRKTFRSFVKDLRERLTEEVLDFGSSQEVWEAGFAIKAKDRSKLERVRDEVLRKQLRSQTTQVKERRIFSVSKSEVQDRLKLVDALETIQSRSGWEFRDGHNNDVAPALDVLVSTTSPDDVSVLMNNGDGTLSSAR